MHPCFVDVAQKVNRTKIIDKKRVFERITLLSVAIIQLSVGFVAWTINGTLYAVMDKKGALSSHATVLHATVLHAIAAPVRWQCAPEGDSAAPAHRSALHTKDAPICLRLIGSYERYVRASRASDSVLSRSK